MRDSAFFGAAFGAVGAAAIAAVSCITAPPPDLPTLPLQRPTIDHQAVNPPGGVLLVWPDTFSVPVVIATPGETFFYSVFLDSILQVAGNMTPLTATQDGMATVLFQASTPSTDTCPHELVFVVANGFSDVARHTPNAVGGDVVDWLFYNGGPGGPMGCPVADAGSGALPEAASNMLPVPPIDDGGSQ